MTKKRPRFVLERVYDPPAATDGTRVLVDRLWPRGISKDKAGIDLWLKAVAPSDALRRKVHGDPAAWPDFAKAYARELATGEAAEAARQLHTLASSGPVTLLYASKNTERNNATALRDWLER